MSDTYIEFADRFAERIANGDLALGARLPPQRLFAYEEGIAVSTASRVYEELARRGLVTGEVGRGTFVSNRFAPLDPSLQEPAGSGIDLDIVFRLSDIARSEIAASTSRFFKLGLNGKAVAPPSVRGTRSATIAIAKLLTTDQFNVHGESLLLAGSGKEAIAASFAALAPRGGRIAVEEMTYPFVLSMARMLGIDLVPLKLDREGVVPDALEREAENGLAAIYLQPTLQSPLVLTMTQNRRKSIAKILEKHELIAIEDRVYSFLKPTKPLAAYAPNNVVLVDSLSKRLMPGLSLGIILAPVNLRETLSRSLRSGGWMASSLAVSLAQHWIEEGVVSSVETAKRQEARVMFNIAKQVFFKNVFRSYPGALHGWIALPKYWRSEAFAAASASLGIAVAPGSVFAVQSGRAPSGVRIAFSAPNLKTWKFALQELNDIIQRVPD